MKTYALIALLIALGVACSQAPVGRRAGEVIEKGTLNPKPEAGTG